MADHDDEAFLMDDRDDDEYAPRNRRDSNRRDSDRRERGGGRVEPHRGVLILVFGILGLIFCAIFGIFAWIWGNEDMRKIRAGRMDPEGEGLTQAGRVLGIIACCLLIGGLVIGVLLLGLGLLGGAASSSM